MKKYFKITLSIVAATTLLGLNGCGANSKENTSTPTPSPTATEKNQTLENDDPTYKLLVEGKWNRYSYM